MEALNLLPLSSIPRRTFSAPPRSNPRTHSVLNTKPRISTLSLVHSFQSPESISKNQDSSYPESQKPSQPISEKPNSPPSASSSSSSPSSSCGLVFDLGPPDSWDCKEIGSPVIKRFHSDEGERWFMWHHGVSSKDPDSDSIGLAVSSNGIHWERGQGAVKSSGGVGLVMNSSEDWWAFDTKSIRPGEVLIMSSSNVRASGSVYWLYYTGYSSERVGISGNNSVFNLRNPERICFDGETMADGEIYRSHPGLAMSQDGRHWAGIEGEHHTGALFDVGSERDWEALFVASPKVVFHGKGDLRMYYHSFDAENGEFSIGIARSRDVMKWVKLGKIIGGGERGRFDEFGVLNPCVVRNKTDGTYVMAYEGVGGGGERCIGLAVSEDGLKDWGRVGEAVMSPGEQGNGWDSVGVGCPYLVPMEGEIDEWRLYYRGVGNGGRTGIGMAVSDASDFTRFRRWTGFHV